MNRYDWGWNRGFGGRRGRRYGRGWGGYGERRPVHGYDRGRAAWGRGAMHPYDQPYGGGARGRGYDRGHARGWPEYPRGWGGYGPATGADRGRFGGEPPRARGGRGGRYGPAAAGGMGARYGSSYAADHDWSFGFRFDDEEDQVTGFLDDEALEDDFADVWSEVPTDDDLRERVRMALRRDGFIDAEAIQVEASDQVVTLRGEVGDYMQARYAWDDTWDVPGVRGVVSKLTVRGLERQEAPQGAAKKAAGKGKKK